MEQAWQEQERPTPDWPQAALAQASVTVVCIADTHDMQSQHRIAVPDGDILIHAGDLTNGGTVQELARALGWLSTLPHRNKLVVAGNHDLLFENDPSLAKALVDGAGGFVYLKDREVVVEGVRIYGSPWTPRFYGAFNLERGPQLARAWSKIPKDLDILVTHGPPAGILDRTSDGEHAGCKDLLRRVAVARPRFHVFGHIHEGHGNFDGGGVTYLNVAIIKPGFDGVWRPTVITL